MSKKYNSGESLGLGNMTSDMSKQQKDQIERSTDAQLEKHFSGHRELPNGKDFTCWNREHQPVQDRKYKANFDSIFGPGTPGYGI